MSVSITPLLFGYDSASISGGGLPASNGAGYRRGARMTKSQTPEIF